jgi:pimeloyl-ACP methyl ester carboxylesterase
MPTTTGYDVPGTPRGLVLMLHGGTARSTTPVDDRSASWRRSAWMMRRIADTAAAADVSVRLLRYRVRGWNEETATPPDPVIDARHALDEIRAELGDVPVVLLGHSMGGRTAVAVADHPSVTGVVALAPWLPGSDPVTALAGRHLAAAHGRADRITSPRMTQAFVRRAAPLTATAEYHDMGRVGHYMFRRIRRWDEFAVSRSLAFLDDHAHAP